MQINCTLTLARVDMLGGWQVSLPFGIVNIRNVFSELMLRHFIDAAQPTAHRYAKALIH
jgi:hypothetical protein